MPTFGIPSPVENGYVNLSNGNLHLEFDLGTFPQRGKKQLTAKLVYDSRIWQVDPASNSWRPTNVANAARDHQHQRPDFEISGKTARFGKRPEQRTADVFANFGSFSANTHGSNSAQSR